MAFLTEQDLHSAIYPHLLKSIKQQDETIVVFGIDAATEEVSSQLKERFKTDDILTAEGEKRNPLLLMMTRDIALFNIIGIANPGVDYEDKAKRAEAARDWLKAVRGGDITPNLPLKDKEQQITKITYGGNQKRNQHY